MMIWSPLTSNRLLNSILVIIFDDCVLSHTFCHPLEQLIKIQGDRKAIITVLEDGRMVAYLNKFFYDCAESFGSF